MIINIKGNITHNESLLFIHLYDQLLQRLQHLLKSILLATLKEWIVSACHDSFGNRQVSYGFAREGGNTKLQNSSGFRYKGISIEVQRKCVTEFTHCDPITSVLYRNY